MKGIIHTRVDDRLIHGQVVTVRTNNLEVARIMATNDEVANSDLQESALRMAAPSNVSTSIITRETALKNTSSGKYEGQKVFIVVKSPLDLSYLIKNGLDIKRINVGNMSSKSNTEVIRPSISVTPEGKKAFKELIGRGVEVTAIVIPTDPLVYLKGYL